MKHFRGLRGLLGCSWMGYSWLGCLLLGQDGQSLVELGVVLPVLLLIATGIGAFGVTINNYVKLVDAVNDGARQLVLSRSQTNDPCATISAVVIQGSPSLTASSLSFTFVLNGTTFKGRTCPAGAADLVQGQPAEVMATYPCSLAAYKVNFAPSCSLQTQTTELVQ